MRTSSLRQCALDLLLIPQRGKVLRLRRRVVRDAPAARAVAGATPQSEGRVRGRGEVEIHTSPLPSWGRSRSINPWREGHLNAAVGHGGSTRSTSGCRHCPNCSRRSPASVRSRGRWLRPPTAAVAPTPRSASASTQRPPSGFQPLSMETAGSRRRSGLPRVGMPPP